MCTIFGIFTKMEAFTSKFGFRRHLMRHMTYIDIVKEKTKNMDIEDAHKTNYKTFESNKL